MWSTGINRNIVECKGKLEWYFTVISSVLIETLWNVKEYSRSAFLVPEEVLIETLWNVKVCVQEEKSYGRSVLIETLWNVKLDISFEVFFQVVRINRNIVECKVHFSALRS